MRIYGIDFTSAPSAKKPIACAMCRIERGRLSLDALTGFESLECFANFLASDGPWVAGLDFPFGLPRELLRDLRWAPHWPSYVGMVSAMSRREFHTLARSLAERREPGCKYPRRETDRRAGAVSPMNVTRPPVGLMFHAGAPDLLASPVSVIPVRPRDDARVVLEAYPRLVADALVGRHPYKDDVDREPGNPRRRRREALLGALSGAALERHYGMRSAGLAGLAAEFVEDTSGDRIDALMCAVQAAWAWLRRDRGYGVPPEADPAEGWIADPALARATAAAAAPLGAG